jgi:hypothetical protein
MAATSAPRAPAVGVPTRPPGRRLGLPQDAAAMASGWPWKRPKDNLSLGTSITPAYSIRLGSHPEVNERLRKLACARERGNPTQLQLARLPRPGHPRHERVAGGPWPATRRTTPPRTAAQGWSDTNASSQLMKWNGLPTFRAPSSPVPAAGRPRPPPHGARRKARNGIPDTNPLERLNGEIKRRTDVVGIFPYEAAITRPGAPLLYRAPEHDPRRRQQQLCSALLQLVAGDRFPAGGTL